MNGKGKITYNNGEFYEGNFLNGLYHGEGIYYWPNGSIFRGAYKKGKKQGFGMLTMDGVCHELCWVNDRAEGKPMNYQ